MKKTTTAFALLLVAILAVTGVFAVETGVAAKSCDSDLDRCLDLADAAYLICRLAGMDHGVCQWIHDRMVARCFNKYWRCLYG